MRHEPPPATEQRHPDSTHLDSMTAEQMLTLMDHEDHYAVRAVASASTQLATVAHRVANSFQAGGQVIMLGAGTSGRIAVQEVAELPPTFGIAHGRFSALVASGVSLGTSTVTASEDDTRTISAELAARVVGPGDVVIGVAASGTTPFVIAGLRSARQLGALTVGIANNEGTPVLTESDLPILLDTGPEVLTGSTRMKAGTAQKIALNRITTVAMVLSGRVTSNYMTELTGSVEKLRERAVRIVCDLAGVGEVRARHVLEEHDWQVRSALSAVVAGVE